jgi:microcin C transport system ATP-binding protein
VSLPSVEHLRVAFPAPGGTFEAVKDSSFAIDKGEILALVGESGSGKSLTALALMGLLPGNALVGGRITFRHEALGLRHEKSSPSLKPKASSLSPTPIRRGKDAALIFQEPMTSLNPLHTIRRQIGEMLSVHQPLMKRGKREARILELLDQVGLSHLKTRLDAYPHQLSGGERQRVMIAIAIANNPALLIADEPTTAVDVTIQKQILELLLRLRQETGMAILLITHDLTIVQRIADKVMIMQKGEIVETGETKRIFASPQHPYTQKLLASAPKGRPVPCPPDAPSLLTVKDLRVEYLLRRRLLCKSETKIAVESASFGLREGETLGIVGESGSGKSSLGYALLRLVKSSGIMELRNSGIPGFHDSMIPLHALSPAALRPLRREMQIVFQDPFSSLNPRMTIRDIINEGLRVHFPAEPEAARERRIDEALFEVGLDAAMKSRFAHEFSGGQRQRIAIARAMVLKPRLVVLDEPTSALDLTIQSQILALLAGLQQKHRTSYIFISHDLRVVRAIAHRILVMRNGQIVESGEAEALFSTPHQPYTRALLDAAFLA